ncbi:hypothetical protein QQF64_035052 [Cirrhinus molitorella]|uniref:Uncharacterized protein n=1 Tax=Cirrhinus molitorella TaxID=172907 RepID=A0ABR3NEP2_9TELE
MVLLRCTQRCILRECKKCVENMCMWVHVYKRPWLGWRQSLPFTSLWPCGPAMPCMCFSGFEMGFMRAGREREKARAAVTWAALFHSPLAMATDRGPRNMPPP